MWNADLRLLGSSRYRPCGGNVGEEDGVCDGCSVRVESTWETALRVWGGREVTDDDFLTH